MRALAVAAVAAGLSPAALPQTAGPASAAGWKLARSAHFEVYSQAGDQPARAALAWFEQLRAFLVRHTGLLLEGRRPVRVVGFRSPREYEPYRIRPFSTAHYAGTESRDYIVLPALSPDRFGTAAHEYAHSVLHAGGFLLPRWLAEGLAEYFSTVRISGRGSTIGGDLPERSRVLRTGQWIPLARLAESSETTELFYAESWAVAEMLLHSPQYAARFPMLAATLAAGTRAAQAMTAIYGKTLESADRDARAWAGRPRAATFALAGVPPGAGSAVEVTELSPYAVRALMADLLAAEGELDRSEAAWRALDSAQPGNPDPAAALGAIALARGDRAAARREWKRAIDGGVADASLCHRYAALASAAGLPDSEVRPALERAVALDPDYDDARYQLALLEKNAGRFEAALLHLRALRHVAPGRAFAYWCAMADTLTQLGERQEAAAAARRAAGLASDAMERATAARLEYVAATELAVRMAPGPGGSSLMVATRVPAGATDWNPFIQADDDIRRTAGALRGVECGTLMRFLVDTQAGRLVLALPDPSRVQVRNGSGDFTCGPQPGVTVTVVYAAGRITDPPADGVLRGIEFR